MNNIKPCTQQQPVVIFLCLLATFEHSNTSVVQLPSADIIKVVVASLERKILNQMLNLLSPRCTYNIALEIN